MYYCVRVINHSDPILVMWLIPDGGNRQRMTVQKGRGSLRTNCARQTVAMSARTLRGPIERAVRKRWSALRQGSVEGTRTSTHSAMRNPKREPRRRGWSYGTIGGVPRKDAGCGRVDARGPREGGAESKATAAEAYQRTGRKGLDARRRASARGTGSAGAFKRDGVERSPCRPVSLRSLQTPLARSGVCTAVYW